MKKNLFVVLMITFTTQAFALKLAERKALKSWNESLKEELTFTDKKCGTKLTGEIDQKMITPFMEANATAAGYCGQALSGVRGLCESDQMSKDAVKESVKKIKCELAAEKGPDFALKGGVFTVKVTTNSANVGQKARKFLENNL